MARRSRFSSRRWRLETCDSRSVQRHVRRVADYFVMHRVTGKEAAERLRVARIDADDRPNLGQLFRSEVPPGCLEQPVKLVTGDLLLLTHGAVLQELIQRQVRADDGPRANAFRIVRAVLPEEHAHARLQLHGRIPFPETVMVYCFWNSNAPEAHTPSRFLRRRGLPCPATSLPKCSSKSLPRAI